MALCMCLCFETYARPSEIMNLVVESVVLPIPSAAGRAGQLTVVMRSAHLGVANKVGDFDHAVPLDLARHAWLAHVLAVWVRRLPPGPRRGVRAG